MSTEAEKLRKYRTERAASILKKIWIFSFAGCCMLMIGISGLVEGSLVILYAMASLLAAPLLLGIVSSIINLKKSYNFRQIARKEDEALIATNKITTDDYRRPFGGNKAEWLILIINVLSALVLGAFILACCLYPDPVHQLTFLSFILIPVAISFLIDVVISSTRCLKGSEDFHKELEGKPHQEGKARVGISSISELSFNNQTWVFRQGAWELQGNSGAQAGQAKFINIIRIKYNFRDVTDSSLGLRWVGTQRGVEFEDSFADVKIEPGQSVVNIPQFISRNREKRTYICVIIDSNRKIESVTFFEGSPHKGEMIPLQKVQVAVEAPPEYTAKAPPTERPSAGDKFESGLGTRRGLGGEQIAEAQLSEEPSASGDEFEANPGAEGWREWMGRAVLPTARAAIRAAAPYVAKYAQAEFRRAARAYVSSIL